MPGAVRRWRGIACGVLVVWASAARAAQPDARDILDSVEQLLWGKTLQGRFEMTVRTPSWQRTLKLQVWVERPERSFIRVTAPAKEAGIGSLRIKSDMWNYLPGGPLGVHARAIVRACAASCGTSCA